MDQTEHLVGMMSLWVVSSASPKVFVVISLTGVERSTNEGNVIFDIITGQARMVWDSTEGGNARKYGIGLNCVNWDCLSQTGFVVGIPESHHHLVECYTTRPCVALPLASDFHELLQQ
jgi:hypothetical protein